MIAIQGLVAGTFQYLVAHINFLVVIDMRTHQFS